jgi:hypothetical protein
MLVNSPTEFLVKDVQNQLIALLYSFVSTHKPHLWLWSID